MIGTNLVKVMYSLVELKVENFTAVAIRVQARYLKGGIILCKEYFSVQKINENTYNIFDPAMVFCTLIIGKDKVILFDTCYGLGDLKSVVESITNLPVTVINSHGHIDHIGGNWQFDKAYIHEEEIATAKIHSSKDIREKTIKNLKDQKIPPQFEEYYEFPTDFSEEEFIERKEAEYIPLKEGTIFDLGEREVEVIVIKGHTGGGIGLLDMKSGMLFAGDAISPFTWIYLDESTSVKSFIESLKEVKKFEFNQIIASHSQKPLGKDIIDKLISCLENIDKSKSKPFYSPLVNREGLMYSEGGEPFKSPDFVAVVYLEEKLK